MDAKTLYAAMGGSLSLARYEALLPAFNAAMVAAGITTPLRAAHWCSQLGHESGGLRWMEEIASGSAYEGRTDLGNTQSGDGVRFKGRGPIQVTGRYNYTAVSKWAHSKGLVPTATFFVDNPAQLASDQYGFIGPVWYWTVARPGLNALCDADDVVGVTKAINGGTNGLADRNARLATCKALGAALLPSGTSTTGGGTVGLDYYNVEPHATLLTSSYTAGRNGKTINCIYRHHMAGNLNLSQCVALWNTSGTSAHYTVNATGGIGQAVYDSNTAWATGNTEGNQRGISIEHANSTGRVNGSDTNSASWNMTDATIIGGARLAAALCLYYKLGRPVYGKNIKDHKDVRQTFCPGHLANGGMYHQKWMNEAQSFYDKLVAKSVNPDGSPKAAGGGSQSGATNTGASTGTTKGDDMALAQDEREALFDIRAMLMTLCAQDMGDGKKAGPYGGWAQTGNRTRTDLLAAIGEKVGVPNTFDTKGDK
jgi:predicted chitinase